MFRPWLRTARPDDWTGTLVEVVMAGLLVLFVVTAILVVIPPRWLALAAGYEEPVRLVFVLVALYLWGWTRALAIAALPRAPFFIFGRLVFREGGRRHRLRAREIVEIVVEARLPDDVDVFVVVLRDGTRHDLCPVTWRGAGRLYRRLRRYVRD
ncbi:MAG: hypothetical protein H6710_03100 [Myxococcales bacterium]|nr:hypothetical protein [Myxococcales bacterium]MCB9702744.1 hypothetical protein [Myxococcales bacterium]